MINLFGDGCDSRYKTLGADLYLCKKGFSHTACNAENCTKKVKIIDTDKLAGKVFQHFKGGIYLVLHVDGYTHGVKYMRLSDKEIFHRDLDEFTGNKELPSGEVVKRFRLLEGYSFTDGAQNERERILDLIDREIECLEYHVYSDKTFGLYRAKGLIEKSDGGGVK